MKNLYLLFYQCYFLATSLRKQWIAGWRVLSGEDLLRTVKILASAEFDGRLPGSEGYNKAANFAAGSLMSLD